MNSEQCGWLLNFLTLILKLEHLVFFFKIEVLLERGLKSSVCVCVFVCVCGCVCVWVGVWNLEIQIKIPAPRKMNWFIIAGFHKARTNFFSLKNVLHSGILFPLSLIVKQPRSSDVPLTRGGVTLFRRTEGSKLKSRIIKVGRLRFHRLFNSPTST